MAAHMEIIRKTLGIEKFNYFQQQAFEALLDNHDVFVGTKTGVGKRLSTKVWVLRTKKW